jgi:hypothetical protein
MAATALRSDAKSWRLHMRLLAISTMTPGAPIDANHP